MKFSSLLLLTITFASCSTWTPKNQITSNTPYDKAARFTASATDGGERLFRVNRQSISDDGYAIGWGVKGQSVDFEALDHKTPEEIADFESKSKIVNYVVEIENNLIISEINNEDMLDYRIAGSRRGNHYSVGTEKIAINNLDYDKEAFAVVQNYKWSNEISNLYIMKRGDMGISTVLNLAGGKFDEMLKTAILKDLKKKDQIDLFKNGSTSITKFEEINFATKEKAKVIDVDRDPLLTGRVMIKATKFTMETEIPKGNGGLLTIQAIVDIETTATGVSLYVLSIDSKLEK